MTNVIITHSENNENKILNFSFIVAYSFFTIFRLFFSISRLFFWKTIGKNYQMVNCP